MARPGPVRIACPICQREFTVPTRVLGVDATANVVTVVMDRSELYGHLQQCAGDAGEAAGRELAKADPDLSVAPVELSGRVERFLNGRAPDGGRFFVAKGGSRACTMCGMSGESCLSLVGQNTRQACCQLCADGNTHPAPLGGMGCAEWAVIHGAKN